jgi:predicted kinase
MVGLPQSGKSSEARLMGYPIVNRDSIRKTLGGTIRYFKEEKRVTEIEHIMVESLFNAGHGDVIVDACHLRKKYREGAWVEFSSGRGYEIRFITVMTSRETCIMRAKRNFPHEPDFPEIIKKMWESSDLNIPKKQSENWK